MAATQFNWNRRVVLAGIAGVAATGAPALAATGNTLAPVSEFPSATTCTYLNSASRHPLGIPMAKAMQDYIEMNFLIPDGSPKIDEKNARVLAKFAALINADPLEVAYIPSTTAGENMALEAIGFPGAKGNIVTDSLHYDGSTYLYARLKQLGVEVRRIEQRDGRIEMADVEKAIDHDTKLVSLSLVSYANGFYHDLKAVCDLAHAHGALVYADIIQAVGAIPVDVRATNVDICAASDHKWLMGDRGLGFIYVRKDLLDGDRLKPKQYGYKQALIDFNIFRERPKSTDPVLFKLKPGAVGKFEMGTFALGSVACLDASLDYIARLGVPAIQAHAAMLADHLRREVPRLGHESLSPPEAAAHISAFRVADPISLKQKLTKANVAVRLTQNFMRVSFSVFNSSQDVEKLLSVLA